MILAIIIYLLMSFIVGKKQSETMKRNSNADNDSIMFLSTLLAVAWPITLSFYIVRVVFFEEWI